MGIDVRDYWDFNDPAKSETIFRNLLNDKSFTTDEQLEIWAQIARTYSLRVECYQCHATLDEHWDAAMAAGPRPRACFQLERGRSFRTGKNLEAAKPYFEAAAKSTEEDLMIDALHMLAIMENGRESDRINLQALELAEISSNLWAKRWQGTLCNNLGWSAFEAERFEDAVHWFSQAVEHREKYSNAATVHVAKWCLARGLRATGDLESALNIQTELAKGDPDGFVNEEIGEIFLAQGKPEDAKPHFRKAIALLEPQFGPDSEKIRRLQSLA